MSVITIEIKEEHLLLLKHLKVKYINNEIVLSVVDNSDDETPIPLSNNDKYEYINLVLNGNTLSKPSEQFDEEEYSQSDKDYWDKLFSELPTCVSIILQRGVFETGKFRCKYHDQVWKKIN